jgi:hypothetical protein
MDQVWLYQLADLLFIVGHIVLILFNLFGWAIKALRKFNLISLAITAFSWFGLGIFYGWGYCFLTDWHWSIRLKLGYSISSNSYIHFLIQQISGWNAPENLVDALTAICFIVAVIVSSWLNYKDYSRRHT